MSIVDLKNVKYTIQINAGKEELEILKDVTLQVNKGEWHVITGPSGSGKTTLLQIIATLIHQTAGERRLFKQELNGKTEMETILNIRSKIGYLFQTPFLHPDLKVREFIELQSISSGVGVRTAEEKAEKLLKRFNMIDFANHLPKKLSGGEKQRIALASVLAKQIELLLLDEPTGSLDQENSKRFWELLEELKKDDLTIIMVSHDIFSEHLMDSKHILDYGKLVLK